MGRDDSAHCRADQVGYPQGVRERPHLAVHAQRRIRVRRGRRPRHRGGAAHSAQRRTRQGRARRPWHRRADHAVPLVVPGGFRDADHGRVERNPAHPHRRCARDGAGIHAPWPARDRKRSPDGRGLAVSLRPTAPAGVPGLPEGYLPARARLVLRPVAVLRVVRAAAVRVVRAAAVRVVRAAVPPRFGPVELAAALRRPRLGAFTMALKSAPARNLGTDVLGTLTAAPVAGLRAVRAARTCFSNTPNPVIETLSPRATVSWIVSSTALTASVAVFLSPIRPEIASIRSRLFILHSCGCPEAGGRGPGICDRDLLVSLEIQIPRRITLWVVVRTSRSRGPGIRLLEPCQECRQPAFCSLLVCA